MDYGFALRNHPRSISELAVMDVMYASFMLLASCTQFSLFLNLYCLILFFPRLNRTASPNGSILKCGNPQKILSISEFNSSCFFSLIALSSCLCTASLRVSHKLCVKVCISCETCVWLMTCSAYRFQAVLSCLLENGDEQRMKLKKQEMQILTGYLFITLYYSIEFGPDLRCDISQDILLAFERTILSRGHMSIFPTLVN